jgi:hypothetical protein
MIHRSRLTRYLAGKQRRAAFSGALTLSRRSIGMSNMGERVRDLDWGQIGEEWCLQSRDL